MTDTFCDLSKGKCKPCEGGIPPLTADEISALMPKLASDWQVADGKLRRGVVGSDSHPIAYCMVPPNVAAKLEAVQSAHVST